MTTGPKTKLAIELDAQKYNQKGESFRDKVHRISQALSDTEEHRLALKDILGNQRFLPAGRIQNAVGATRSTTAFNCFVSGTIEDSFDDIFDKVKEAGQTMRMGGGIGYDFSRLRPKGDRIKSLDSTSSGPISFMGVFNEACKTIVSAGHRRGAMMGVMRVDHPDIEEFILAKQNDNALTNFNVSVGVTDDFMLAVEEDGDFDLVFEGEVYETIKARVLWDKIMRSTWDYAEPGVLFLDTMNRKNNLWYCETLEATNPCAEQSLPPYGACLLGSFNLVKYTKLHQGFDYEALRRDIPPVVRAVDNVIDQTDYPLEKQKQEAINKRRMGLGVTGLANAGAMLGYDYGSPDFLLFAETVLKTIRDSAYWSSVELAIEKGAFPAFDWEEHSQGQFIQTLPEDLQSAIKTHGIRNSHLTSIAPTGTISIVADNVSSGIEPPFLLEYTRDVFNPDGSKSTELVQDYAYREYGIEGVTADKVSPTDHVKVLTTVSKYVDSAVSKTCNVPSDCDYEEFKGLYIQAWEGGASGCTTYRPAKRKGILNAVEEKPEEIVEGGACVIDPLTGVRSCE